MAANFSPLSKYVSLFLLGVLVCFNLPAQAFNEAQGFDKRVFEYHFDRADRELNPSSWLEEARKGVGFVFAAWERAALELYGDPALFAEAGREFARLSEEELERRFSQWLFRRFFGNGTLEPLKTMEEAVAVANRLYAYHTDGEGNILYGETGSPESIRPTDGRSLEEDRLFWHQLVNSAGETALGIYQFSLASAFPELLFYLKDPEKAGFENQLREHAAQTLISKQAEFEALLAREERLFVARRTGDIWSLRKQSENESAAAVTSRLIRDAENICTAGINSLEEKIEAAKAGYGDLSLMGEDWLTAFQDQFERGLKAWGDAEERFIIRRMEWERDSTERYQEGYDSWVNAFYELENQRLAWEEKVKELFFAGEQLFINASELLNTAISQAREEFQRETALRVNSAAERASALLDMYLTCSSVLAEAKSSVMFWLTRFVQGAPENALENGSLAEWVRLMMATRVLDNFQLTAAEQLITWADMYIQYERKARESLAALEREFQLAMGLDGNPLRAVLNLPSEDFFLDEYQVELLRVEAIAKYWEQRLSIAEAVSAYAEDISSGRMTEAESLREWREAKSSYEAALEEYAIIQGDLKNAGHDLAQFQENLQAVAMLLSEEERKLEELNNRYALQMAAYRVNSSDFILEEIASCYETLIALAESREKDDLFYTAYLKAEQKYIKENLLSAGWLLLKSAVQDEDDAERKQYLLSLLSAQSSIDWYFLVTCREKNDEAVNALEEEGLLNRLQREASETIQGEKIFSIYRDFSAFAPGLQKEIAESFWYSLNLVFAEFGMVKNSFLDIEAAADALLEYSELNNKSPAVATAELLLKLDKETGIFPVLLESEFEAWKESFVSYVIRKTINNKTIVPENFEAALEKYEEFLDKALELYYLGEDPQEEVTQITFYQYLMFFLAEFNECLAVVENTGGPDYWRNYIPEIDAISLEEGLLLDSLYSSLEASRMLSEAFELLLQGSQSARENEFVLAVETYLENFSKNWEEAAQNLELAIAREMLKEEAEKLQNVRNYEDSLQYRIGSLGYEYINLPDKGQAAMEEIKGLSAEIEEARVNLQNALLQYSQQAESFVTAGNLYESIYAQAKLAFSDVEKRLAVYEKQDAIQRWASTAYLGNSSSMQEDLLYYKEPKEELEYSKEHAERAFLALAALKDIYPDNFSTRPYESIEYNKIYEQYKESYKIMLLSLKARTEYCSFIEEEELRNFELFQSSMESIYLMFPADLYSYFHDYNPPLYENSTWLDYIQINESGLLGISYNHKDFTLNQVGSNDAAVLTDYFLGIDSTGVNHISGFEAEYFSWINRMAGYGLEGINNFQTWSLAYGYLVRNIAESNENATQIASSYNKNNLGTDGFLKLNKIPLNDHLEKYQNGDLLKAQENAWNSLNEEQKADLEFLALVYLLNGSGSGIEGFELGIMYDELMNLKNYAAGINNAFVFEFYFMFIRLGGFSIENKADKISTKAIDDRIKSVSGRLKNNRSDFTYWLEKTNTAYSSYLESCAKLETYSLIYEEGICWQDLADALNENGAFTEYDIASIKTAYDGMINYRQSIGESTLIVTVAEGFDAIYLWGKGLKDTLESDLDDIYQSEEITRAYYQDAYRTALDLFLNGELTLKGLETAADLAYGNEAPALKNHLQNIGSVLISALNEIDIDRTANTAQYFEIAENYIDLIKKAYYARYNSELIARENSWNEQCKDLDKKLSSWIEASRLIVERGRKDWKDGIDAMKMAFMDWEKSFMEQYTAIDTAWNAAYLESLTDKENWINQAMGSAYSALDNNLLGLLGADAESYSRKLDCFMPLSINGSENADRASEILKNVLNSAGIGNLDRAFSSINGSAGTINTSVKSGLSGLDLWNSAQAAAVAREFAMNSTHEMADMKMNILAFQARESVLDAKKLLEENIAQNNKEFDKNMDDLFTFQYGWMRSPGSYIKEIIVHSTLFQSAITETAIIEPYRVFVMEYWELITDLSDANLENLDSLGIQALISMAQEEIKEKSYSIFGSPDGVEGLFGIWIGNPPMDEEDTGSGETGRLLCALFEWENKHGLGIYLMNAPLYDKPFWDSRDSWFDAPSIRSVVDIGLSIVANVVGTVLTPFSFGLSLGVAYLINMTDDLLFGMLDVANGQKDWSEFGFEFGKSALINVVSTGLGALFNGAGKAVEGVKKFAGLTNILTDTVKSPIGKVFINTAMTGLQTFTTSTATSALSAVTYTNGKLGWDKDIFSEGFKKGLINTAVAGTSTLTSGLLNLGLEGFYGEYYENGSKLSNLVGGLAGQGVNFALGGDITLNAINLGFIHDKLDGIGFLELHFGRDGFSGNIGLNGVDISAGTLASALNGLEAWAVNFGIWTSDSDDAKKYIKQMRTLYSGDETNIGLYNSILNNETFIAENRNVDYTITEYDEVTGLKIIYLGNDALNDGSRFGLNVVFSHESYRNGKDDGVEAQVLETNLAVMGHISTALGLIGTYGKGSIGIGMENEALGFYDNYKMLISETSSEYEKMQALAVIGSIFNSYDSSADYWKFTSDGRIIYDRRYSLYDEFGALLMEDDGKGGYAESLSRVLGISLTEAEIMYNTVKENNNRSITLDTSASVKVRYYIQRDYINNVFNKYNGDMVLAIQDACKDLRSFMVFQVPMDVFNEYILFAQDWNKTMFGFGEGYYQFSGLWDNSRYNDYAISNAFQQIQQNWSYDGNNPLYSLFGKGNVIDPISGHYYITVEEMYTKGKYAGQFHGSSYKIDDQIIRCGLAIDLGTNNKNLPIYTTQYETLLLQNDPLRGQPVNDHNAGYGYHLRTSTDNFNIIYGHLADSSASTRLAGLINSGKNAGVYTIVLPSGFNFGKVGNTGNSYGEHLHYELKPKFKVN